MDDCSNMIQMGFSGENNAKRVSFDLTKILDQFGTGGRWILLNRRPGEFVAYPVPADQIEINGGVLIWTVKAYDVEHEGRGECQLSYTLGDVVKMTIKYQTAVAASLVGDQTAPDPYETWLQQLAEYADAAAEAAEQANDAKNGAEYAAEQANDARSGANNAASEALDHAVQAGDAEAAAKESQEAAAEAMAQAIEAATQANDSANGASTDADRAADAADRAEAAAAEGAFVIKKTSGTNIDRTIQEINAASAEGRPLILSADGLTYTQDALSGGYYYFSNIQFQRGSGGYSGSAVRRYIINPSGNLSTTTPSVKYVLPNIPATGDYTLTASDGIPSWTPSGNYTLLWQNPDPTATFNQVNVTLSESMEGYKFLIVEAGILVSGQEYRQATAITSPNFFVCFGLEMIARGNASMTFFNRDFAKVDATTIQFHTCRQNVVNKSTGAWSAEVVDYQSLIPFRIYGAK